jgi:hypothetical protein
MRGFLLQKLLLLTTLTCYEVKCMVMKLQVDGKEIPLNDFVASILTGATVGAVTSLKGIKEDWKKIEIEISK